MAIASCVRRTSSRSPGYATSRCERPLRQVRARSAQRSPRDGERAGDLPQASRGAVFDNGEPVEEISVRGGSGAEDVQRGTRRAAPGGNDDLQGRPAGIRQGAQFAGCGADRNPLEVESANGVKREKRARGWGRMSATRSSGSTPDSSAPVVAASKTHRTSGPKRSRPDTKRCTPGWKRNWCTGTTSRRCSSQLKGAPPSTPSQAQGASRQ